MYYKQKINERIKLIRVTEGFTQVEFAKLIGVVNDRSVRMVESGKIKEVGSAKIERICNQFPEYALWLTTEHVQLPHQISPDLAKTNKTTTDEPVKTKPMV